MDNFLRHLNIECEQMQNDLLCLLDGMEQDILDNACQIVVDRIKNLKDKYEDFHGEKL